ncbi:MAG: phage tail protein [Treponema sp.]|uniref:phage tail protein n=1 Tax=Treponema sp. TaxID=166 RepID=UPI0025D30359|nr:phage tail protein [Treponema sp.]MBQ8680589.1 phage tail protein [Treponema sp.]
MSDDSKLSPYLFAVEIDGIETARFQKCEGLEAETEIIEFEEGGGGIHHFQGRTRYPNLILEKGISDNDELFNWYKNTLLEDRKLERKTGSIVLKNNQDEEIKRWNFFKAFPCRWIGPKLDYKNKDTFAVERIEIAHEGLEVDNDSYPFEFPYVAPAELKVDKSTWIAQAGIPNAPVIFDNYGRQTNDPYAVTGLNIGEPIELPSTTKISNAAEKHLDENYFDGNTCDEWASKVLTEAGFEPADYHMKDTEETVKQHIDELKATGLDYSQTSNNSAYVVFMGDGTKEKTRNHEHAGLLVTDSNGKVLFYHSSANNSDSLSIKESYNSVSAFEKDFAYSSFYYQEIF